MSARCSCRSTVALIRAHRPDIRQLSQVWGLPVPSLAPMVPWLLVLDSAGATIAGLRLPALSLGVGLCLLRARRAGEWLLLQQAPGEL